MKTISVDVPIQKLRVVGHKKVTKYVTDDGQQFDLEKDAAAHERTLHYQYVLRNVKTKDFDNFDYLPNTLWYYISDESVRDFIFAHLTQTGYCDHYLNGDRINKESALTIKIGDWVTSVYEDGGDYRSTNHLYTWGFVWHEIKEMLEKLK